MTTIPSPKNVEMIQHQAIEGEIKRVVNKIAAEILKANLGGETVIEVQLEVEPILRKSVIEAAGKALNSAGWSAKANLNELTGLVVFTLTTKRS